MAIKPVLGPDFPRQVKEAAFHDLASRQPKKLDPDVAYATERSDAPRPASLGQRIKKRLRREK